MAEKLRFLTWNIWFSPLKIAERMNSIAIQIKELNPHVFCLQEMTKLHLAFLLSSLTHLGVTDYKTVHSVDLSKENQYFNVIFSKLDLSEIKRYDFDSLQGRNLLVCKICFNGIEITVSTVHLESPCPGYNSKENALRRTNQLKKAVQILRNDAIILAGDFNWKGKLQLKTNTFVDAWDQLKRGENGFTYDGIANPMLRNGFRSRLDRVVFSKENLTVDSIKMVGMNAIKDCFYRKRDAILPVLPSDHFGLYCEFTIP